MKKRVALLCLLPLLLNADDLSVVLDNAMKKNRIIQANNYVSDSKKADIQAVQRAYGPTVNLGGNYQSLNQRNNLQAGDVYEGFVNVGIDIFDGNKKKHMIDQNRSLYESSKFNASSYSKQLQLSIIQDFFNIKSKESQLEALFEKQEQLDAELDRIQKFYAVGSATIDDVDKLKAAYSNNRFIIDSVKHELLSLKQLFTIKVGYPVKKFEVSSLKEPMNTSKEKSDYINSLEKQASSLKYAANAVESEYMPKLRLEDTYSYYDYERTDATHPEGLDKQNKLLLSLNIKLFDTGVATKQKNSLLLQKKALEEQIEQEKTQQEIQIELANSKIYTVKTQIVSAKKSLEAASSAYETIQNKFKAGAVDNVAYLDALSERTTAKSQYEEALNNLQIAYASYYYYTNKNIREFVK